MRRLCIAPRIGSGREGSVGCLGRVGPLGRGLGLVGARWGVLGRVVAVLGPRAFVVIVRWARLGSNVGVALFLVNSRKLTTSRRLSWSILVKCRPLGQCLVSRAKFVPVSLNVFRIYGVIGVRVVMVRCGLLGLL